VTAHRGRAVGGGPAPRRVPGSLGPGQPVTEAAPQPPKGGVSLVVGLTGGIGSGKSTVGALLERAGARWVDADRLAREALEPGTPGSEAVRQRFGDVFFEPDGRLDRAALARTVFADDEARRELEAIVHPVVRAGLARAVAEAAGTGAVVVLEIPLLDPSAPPVGLDAVLVVDVPEEVAVERLVTERNLPREDALARVRAQRPLAEQRARAGLRAGPAPGGAGPQGGDGLGASFVLENRGDRDELGRAVAAAWAWLGRLRAEKAVAGQPRAPGSPPSPGSSPGPGPPVESPRPP